MKKEFNHIDETMNGAENLDHNDTGNETINRKKNKKKHIGAKVVALAVALGLVSGGVVVGMDAINNRPQKTELNSSVGEHSTIDATQTEAKEYTGVSEIVENVKPAIVAITSTTTAVNYDFWGRPVIQEASGAGSGIIIGQNGNELLIATNNHVIADANSIVLQFIDETTATGEVKGAEQSSDLAVISVNMKDLSEETRKKIKVASLGDSNTCIQGELVVAIGNALGYGQSTTVGYLSALDREVTVDGVTLNLIQTDAAINPGNSGGALLNAKGEVIGINSVKYIETAVEGVGYAIPISTAVPIINDLMNREDLSEGEKGYLGITGRDVTEYDAEALNIPIGIYVNRVEKGSPADRAGIKVGDVITAVSGRTMKTQEELQNFLNYTRGGTKVTFTVSVYENGDYAEKSIEIVLGNRK